MDGLTTVVNAFAVQNISVNRAADVMFETVRRGKTSFDELSAAMFQAAPLAAAAGIRFEEVAAATASLTQSGTPTTEAMTQIRAAITGLLKPSDAAVELFQQAGYESGQAAIKALGFGGALDLVNKATQGNIGQMTKVLGRIEGVNAALNLTGPNAARFADHLRGMETSAGAADGAFELMAAGFERRWNRFRATFDRMRIEVGTELLPIVAEALEGVAAGVSDSLPMIKEYVGALSAAFGTSPRFSRKISLS